MLIVFNIGCDRNPTIRVYEVPREETTSQLAKANPGQGAGMTNKMSRPIPSGPRRFLIAVIPNKESVIFIKGSDTPERLDGLADSLTEIAKSIQFDGPSEKPTWIVPSDWSEAPSTDGIAMAKFKATAGPANSVEQVAGVDFTLSQLPKPLATSEWPDYFEQNINRWRGQLGLPATSLAQSKSTMTEVTRDGSELPAYLVDLRNEATLPESSNSFSDSPTQNPTPSAPAEMTAPDTSTPDTSALKTESKLKYTIPEGWKDEGARGMRAASFSFEGKRDSDSESSKGEATVIFAGGDRLANVVRWQGQLASDKPQVEQQSAAEKAIAEATDLTAGGGQTGQLYRLVGSEDPSSPAMLAAIIPMENGVSSVFVKLTAPTWLADEQKSRLIGFTKSLSW